MSLRQIVRSTTMGEILEAYPAAKVGLFQRYHIGGCESCGYQPTDTLEQVKHTQNIQASVDEMIACIRESTAVEARLHTTVADVAGALKQGEALSLLDVRAPEEWEKGKIEGAQLLTVNLTFEILDSPVKDTPIVLYSNHGTRSLDKASYFSAYGMTNATSMDGGLEAWTSEVGSVEIR